MSAMQDLIHTQASSGNSQSIRAGSTGQNKTRVSADSVMSFVTSAPSFDAQGLAPLQHKDNLDEVDRLAPLLEDDPRSFDLVEAADNNRRIYSLETRSQQLFSKEHLEAIFQDTVSLLRFTSYLNVARPTSVPTLNYYLTAVKALQAIKVRLLNLVNIENSS